MFKELEILSAAQVAELRGIAASARFVDGRISNPHSTVKQNLQLHDEAAYDRSSQILTQALYGHEDFQNFAFPVAMLPPMMARYTSEMRYGAHADAAFLQLGNMGLRSDLSCTVFLSDPDGYEGGDLVARLGNSEVRLRAAAGSAIVYPSTTIHRVEEVTKGERLVALTFIESRIADGEQRELLYELNEVAAAAGEMMDVDTYTRLQRVQQNLMRKWGDPD